VPSPVLGPGDVTENIDKVLTLTEHPSQQVTPLFIHSFTHSLIPLTIHSFTPSHFCLFTDLINDKPSWGEQRGVIEKITHIYTPGSHEDLNLNPGSAPSVVCPQASSLASLDFCFLFYKLKIII
jgi:hypothetical protein